MELKDSIRQVKKSSYVLASLPEEIRNGALEAVCKALQARENEILQANEMDLEAAEANNLPGPLLSRLRYDRKKNKGCIDGILDLIDMPDPLFRAVLKRELDTGLVLTKETDRKSVV